MKSRVSGVFFLLAGSVLAQLDGSSHRVTVRVDFSDGGCDGSAHVRLVSRSGAAAEAIPNERCEVDFNGIADGTYHVSVSGRNFSDTDSIITTTTGVTEFDVKVPRASGNDMSRGASVSAADLRVPPKAQKEFDRANDFTAKQDYARAIETLKHAIAIYPDYAAAYNNLGTVYSRLNDRTHEREALEKAISLNDHLAPAHMNLARMDMTAGDFPTAEAELKKASSCDPLDGITMVLLAYSEFMEHHYDDAITTSHKAHMLANPHAYAHQVAARSFEQKRDGADAIAELELFLKEEPAGQRADSARKELAALQAIPR
jgi:tetratricopeptide (TPR) repeat protein